MEQQNRGKTSWNVNHSYVINMSSQINSFFCSSSPSSKMLSAKIKTYALDTTPRIFSRKVKTSFSGMSVQINYVLTNHQKIGNPCSCWLTVDYFSIYTGSSLGTSNYSYLSDSCFKITLDLLSYFRLFIYLFLIICS